MECGIQISSFRPVLKTTGQVEEVFKKLYEMDCRTVQLQWIDPAVPVENIAIAMKRYNIRSVSVQEIYEDFRKNPDYFVRLNHKTGGTWICVSRIPREWLNPEGLLRMKTELQILQEQLKKESMQLCFHPIRADYQEIQGMSAYESLLRDLPEMQLCLDLRHCHLSGYSIPELIHRYAGRICMVHFKDGLLQPDGTDLLCPLGEGDTNWSGSVKACLETGIPYAFAEQEKWQEDPFVALQKSLDWLRKETAETV